MSDSPIATSSPSASLRWPIRFAIVTWLAAAGLVAIFALFWRMAYAPPHAFWAVITTGSLVAAGGLTVVSGARSFFRGPRRALAAAVVVLGTTPIAWGAAYFATLYLQSTYREPISLGVPTRIVAFWAESAGDLEARCRYSRWTPGRHVVLLDNGQTPQARALVAGMDEHIEQIAANLNASLPDGRVRWVRGPLLGQSGRALVSWAICDTQDDLPELTPLDRHEVAHIVILAMGGVDQEPPMLLAEGWAESQSKDRADLIRNLAWLVDQHSTYSLDELIGPEWYGRSDGPAYNHGGPLVVYLMEHYGPEKFLKFYHGVRQSTFRADCERILGDPWPVVEQQFWVWLTIETSALHKSNLEQKGEAATENKLVLAESVDRADWQTIADGYRAAWSERPPIPVRFAFSAERKSSGSRNNSADPVVTYEMKTQCVIDGDDAWQLDVSQRKGSTTGAIATADESIYYLLTDDGRVVERDRRRRGDYVRSAVRDLWDQESNAADLGHYLPVDADRRFNVHVQINDIRRPADDESVWEIKYVVKSPDDPDEFKYTLLCDAAADWCVVSAHYQSAGSRNEHRNRLGTIFGRVAAVETSAETKNEEGQWKLQLRLREMDETELQKVRATVEDIARRGSIRGWYESLARPLSLAIAWPAVGVILAGVGVCRRGAAIGQFKAQ